MQQHRAVWRRRQLFPSWIVQIICAGLYVVMAAVLLAGAYIQRHPSPGWLQNHFYGPDGDQLVVFARVMGGVVLAISIGTILLDSAEITMYVRRRLSPALLLYSACVKTLVWVAYFVISLVGSTAGSISVPNIILGLALTLTSIQQLVLGANYTHRLRRERPVSRNRSRTANVEEAHGTAPVRHGSPRRSSSRR
ncbi:hypothetical protein GGR52DRAFT_286923 [Hypoxylon sp. FL1284]|nr:hypothetical protein GGR52DRAFT_286923 [Hypoxylon sp. FL1284]